MTEFETKHGDEREQYESGMQRDKETGKPRFDLITPLDVPYDEQLLTRIARLYSRGAEHYDDRNWEKGAGQAELDRAKSSAFRHFMQWFTGERDEDHAAAVFFNVQAAEYFQWKIDQQPVPDDKWDRAVDGDDPLREVDVVWQAPDTGLTIWSEDGNRFWWIPNYHVESGKFVNAPTDDGAPLTGTLQDVAGWSDAGWSEDAPSWSFGGKDWKTLLDQQTLTQEITLKAISPDTISLAYGGGKHRRPVPVDSPPIRSHLIDNKSADLRELDDEEQSLIQDVLGQAATIRKADRRPQAVLLPLSSRRLDPTKRIEMIAGLPVNYTRGVRAPLVVTEHQLQDVMRYESQGDESGALVRAEWARLANGSSDLQPADQEPVKPPVDLRD
jgi:hypothetical protein